MFEGRTEYRFVVGWVAFVLAQHLRYHVAHTWNDRVAQHFVVVDDDAAIELRTVNLFHDSGPQQLGHSDDCDHNHAPVVAGGT